MVVGEIVLHCHPTDNTTVTTERRIKQTITRRISDHREKAGFNLSGCYDVTMPSGYASMTSGSDPRGCRAARKCAARGGEAPFAHQPASGAPLVPKTLTVEPSVPNKPTSPSSPQSQGRCQCQGVARRRWPHASDRECKASPCRPYVAYSALSSPIISLRSLLLLGPLLFLILPYPVLGGSTSRVVGRHGNTGQRRRPQGHSRTEGEAETQGDSMTYLMRYGYLPQSDMETGALRTHEEVQRALRTFQRFANLPQSGELDDKTREQMVKSRCGLPDVADEQTRRAHGGYGLRVKRYVLAPSMWDKRELTYRILNYPYTLEWSTARRRIVQAFDEWSKVTHLSFHQISQEEADIEIQFARYYHNDGYSFDGSGMILAHAFFPGPDRGGDIHFDDDEIWTDNSSEGTNLFMVAVHEIGHSLGLMHSSVPGALMNPWYQGFREHNVLHDDDIAAVQTLYGYKAVETVPPAVTRPPPTVHADEPGYKPYSTYKPEEPSTTRPTTRRTTTTTPRPRVTHSKPTTPYRRRTKPMATRPPRHNPDRDPAGPADRCATSPDAVTVILSELYSFKGEWFWRFNELGLMEMFPAKIKNFWYGLPQNFSNVDAVYENQMDQKIYFFKGKRYWAFDGNNLAADMTSDGRPLTDIGFPAELSHIDAVFRWSHNQKYFFISGHMYWKLDDTTGRVIEYDYPRDMVMWFGVPVPVDSAFSFDEKTYFVKGTDYYAFKDLRMRVEEDYPQQLAPKWLQCEDEGLTADHNDVEDAEVVGSGSATLHIATYQTAAMATIVLLFTTVAMTPC